MSEVLDALIIGGGPAGLSAACRLWDEGIHNILIVERNKELGGILNQCIHNGFGLHIFKEELTGTEYAARFVDMVNDRGIPYLLNSMVLDITSDKTATVLSVGGVRKIKAKAIILAMGCRERPRGALRIPGERCAGVFTAGTAQEFVNIKGKMPGKEVVILGSGDIGLIMARRMTLEGADVKCVVELMPYSSGLKRNIAQCLNDFDIPLLFNHTVTRIEGKERLEGVYISEVDKNREYIKGTERFIKCDTLLLSVGLIPENELSKKIGVELSGITSGAVVDSDMETNIEGVFSCGNVLHVHDLVDNVTLEAYNAAAHAAKYIRRGRMQKNHVSVKTGKGVRYTSPSIINVNSFTENDEIDIYFRTDGVYEKKAIALQVNGKCVKQLKRRVLTPGEMEKVTLTKAMLDDLGQDGIQSIMVKIEGIE